MAHCEGMLLMEKTLLIFLFGILVCLCPLCWCSKLTALDLRGMQTIEISEPYHTPAHLAIDGDSNPDYYGLSCSHTGEDSHPYWRVDLGTNHCLGRITLVNRGDCCSERLSGATVRAGLESDIINNVACGIPVTSGQASIPGAHIQILCDPPVIARYVSVDIPRREYLTLCEVMVEEYPTEDCSETTTIGLPSAALVTDPSFAGTCMSTLVFVEGCIAEPISLLAARMMSPTQCFVSCKMNDECWSFDYVMTSGQCRLYDVTVEDLKVDDTVKPGCLVYAVVRG